MLRKTFFIFFSIISALSAQKILVDKSFSGKIILTRHLSFFIDKQKLQFQTIIKSPEAYFSKSIQSVNLGFEKNPVWIKIDLENHSGITHFIFEIAKPLLHYVDFYYQADTQWKRVTAGRLQKQNSIKNHKIAFPFEISKGENHTFYFKVQTKDSMIVPVLLWSAEAFYENERTELLFKGSLYGILCIILIYNFFIFISLKDPGYFYYTVYLFFLIFLLSAIDGFLFEFTRSLGPFVNWRLPLFFITCSLVSYSYFAKMFLELKESQPRLWYFLRIQIYAFPGFLFISVFDAGMVFATKYVNFLVLLSILTVGIASVISLIKKNRQAIFFIAAEISLLLSVLVISFKNLGLAPSNILTENLLQVGLLLEVSVLSFALADRMNILRQQNNLFLQEISQKEFQLKEKELNLAKSELERLKRIISPHSLLNSMQSISFDLRKNPDNAISMLSDLANEFRSVILWSQKTEILFSDEIRLCNTHLRIMGRRTGYKYSLKSDKTLNNLMVPPLIFHTLIENSISHESARGKGLKFQIKQGILTPNFNQVFIFECHGKMDSTHVGAGIGSKYIKYILRHTYGDEWDIKETISPNLFRLELSIGKNAENL